MNFIERCIRYPVTVSVAVILIMVFGLIGLTRVPIQLTPNVDQPVVTITTRWFGASPKEVEQNIVKEQEDVLDRVSGVRKMTSVSSEGEGVVRLEFNVGIAREAALNEVRDKLREVPDYPDEVDEPIVEMGDPQNKDWIAWFVVRHDKNFKPSGPVAPGFEHEDVTKLGTFFNETVKPALERAEGISEVQVLGSREQEVQVRVDLQALAARGIPIDEFCNRLRAENVDVTAGTVAEGKRDTSIRVLGQNDFKKETSFVHSRGEPVLAMNAQRESGTNVIAVMNNLKAAIEEVNQNVLGPTNWGLHIDQVYDQTIYIDRAVENASVDLILGAVLAGVVLLLTLRSIGATLVVLVAIPISVVGTFLGMSLFGRSLNVISMAGITFAVGMGVDNAIVVLENIFRHREMGKDRFQAAIDGTKEVWGAVLAASLTNVAVFLPIIFIEQEAGQLFRDLSVALTISFFFYIFVSPTVIPMLATIMIRKTPESMKDPSHKHQTRLAALTGFVGRFESAISNAFLNLVRWLTKGYLVRISLIVVMMALSIIASWKLMPPTDYLPPGNQNFVFGMLFPPPGYNINEYRGMSEVVTNTLRPWWEAKPGSPELKALQDQSTMITQKFVLPGMQQGIDAQRAQLKQEGKSERDIEITLAPTIEQYNQMKRQPPPPAMQEFFFVAFGSSIFMGGDSADPEVVGPMATNMFGTLNGMPGMTGKGFFMQAPIFPSAGEGSSVNLSVYGLDDDSVLQGSGALMGALMQTFGGYPRPDPGNFNVGRDELQIVPNRVRAASANVGGTPAIRDAAQVAVDGLVLGDFRDRGQNIDLTVVSNTPRDARSREQLADIPLATRSGDIVPLGSVADLNLVSAAQQINHYQKQPSVSFTVQIPQGMTVQQAVEIINGELVPGLRTAGALPAGVNIGLEGAAGKLEQFQKAFIPGFALAALITYLLLAALFESFIHPITIIGSVPFAMVGGFASLAVLHHFDPAAKLDVLTLLGFVILIGTIINNPILIVHQALNYLREGMPRREAIAVSTQTRVRPIFMSVVTSVAGMAPLVIMGGAGSELYRGLGAVIVGGLIVSTFFTLILTPVLMSLLLDVQEIVQRATARVMGAKPQAAGGGEPSLARDPQPPGV
jgi:HAE1 family hydrophobic/amphiphilic exporter-1